MINNDFSIERGYRRLLEAKSCARTQEEIISDLESELKSVSEQALLIHAMRLIIELDFRKTSELYQNLESPMKQALYLIDVFYSMGDRGGTETLSKEKSERIAVLLNEMEMAYFCSIGFPNKGDVFHNEDDDKIEVALSTFLNHFCNAKLCFEEQTLDRIARYFKKYDTVIKARFGFYIDDAIKFILHIRHLNNSKFTDIVAKGAKYVDYVQHPEEWRKLTKEFEKRGLAPEEWASQPELEGVINMMTTNPGEICIHSKDEIESLDLTSDVLQNLISFFEYDRAEAEAKRTIYYADARFSEGRPLFKIGDNYVCPINKFFLESLYERLSTNLQNSEAKFKANKDKAFEEKIYEIFKRFFPSTTKMFANYSVDGTSENDLLIGCGTTWIIVEIKNTGFRPPMRDPLRAFDKIKTDFDKSVQLGYDQCKRVEDILLKGSDVKIKDADTKKLLYELKVKKIEQVWSIVVTDYKYGPIQTNLCNLLRKDENALFPWSVCADDLETFLILLKRLMKGIAPARFIEFLDYRERYHGHVMCFDELELCGWYLCDREQFKKFSDEESMVGTIPGMGEIFDAYYKIGLGFPNELDMDAKVHYSLPEFAKSFDMEEVNRNDFPGLSNA